MSDFIVKVEFLVVTMCVVFVISPIVLFGGLAICHILFTRVEPRVAARIEQFVLWLDRKLNRRSPPAPPAEPERPSVPPRTRGFE